VTAEILPQSLGPYLLLEKIGQGSATEVFKAQAPDSQVVAIKRIRSKYMYDSEFVEMLKSEAQTLLRIEHRNIIRVHGFFQEGAVPFIVMEYVEGQSLLNFFRKLQSENKLLSPPAVLFIARETCAALEYLHGIQDLSKNVQKLLHTDLSERNILIGKNGEVKVIDFSAEQCAINLLDNVTDGHWGLLQEMSPERLKGDTIDVESDIFQLGLILYRQLTGRHLFEGKIGFGLYVAIREVNIHDGTLPPTWDSELKNLLSKGLAREPKDRFPSAGEMGRALETYLKNHHPSYGAQDLARELQAL
jgi:serine/threonine-protein kinase